LRSALIDVILNQIKKVQVVDGLMQGFILCDAHSKIKS